MMNFTISETKNLTSPDGQDLYEKIIIANDILGFLAFLATGTASLLILSYLYNVSLAKEGLLLYLYRDFVIILISLRALWASFWLLKYLDKSIINKFPTKLLPLAFYDF